MLKKSSIGSNISLSGRAPSRIMPKLCLRQFVQRRLILKAGRSVVQQNVIYRNTLSTTAESLIVAMNCLHGSGRLKKRGAVERSSYSMPDVRVVDHGLPNRTLQTDRASQLPLLQRGG